MSVYEKIVDLGHRIYNTLTNPKVVKYFTFIGLTFFLSAIIIGVIIALIGPPGNYNPINNYISDMGSFNYTPIPYILDFGNMISSILLVPCVFYLEKLLSPLPQNSEDIQEFSRMRLRLGSYGFIWMIIGLIGMFGTGLFSEDRTTALDLHWTFTIIVFIGFAMTGFFYGLLIVFFDTIVPKLLGVYMIFAPSIIAVILFSFGFQPIHEWIMLLSLLTWIIPLSLFSLREINKELEITR